VSGRGFVEEGPRSPSVIGGALPRAHDQRPRRLRTVDGHVIRAAARAHECQSDQPSRIPAPLIDPSLPRGSPSRPLDTRSLHVSRANRHRMNSSAEENQRQSSLRLSLGSAGGRGRAPNCGEPAAVQRYLDRLAEHLRVREGGVSPPGREVPYGRRAREHGGQLHPLVLMGLVLMG